MQKAGSSRGGHSKSSALEAEFLNRQLSNADLIKRLKVIPCLISRVCTLLQGNIGAAPPTGCHRAA